MQHNDTRRGQSIIEAMVALGVLTVGFLGMVGLLTQSFVLSRTTSNDLNATYLSAEGIEVAESLLAHDTYSGGTWGSFDGAYQSGAESSYEIEYDSGEPGEYQNQVMKPLFSGASCADNESVLDPIYYYTGSFASPSGTSTQVYGYETTGTKTPFTRCIQITKYTDPRSDRVTEITVDSFVYWKEGAGIVPESVQLEDHFYDWSTAS